MIYNMEKFGELVTPENKLSEGKQSIIRKLQEIKREGVSVLQNKEYLAGNEREQELLKKFESSTQLTIIEASKTLCGIIAKNPEEIVV